MHTDTRPRAYGQILIVAMILRLVWAIMMPVEPVSDGVAYDTFARNIWQHGVYGWRPDQPSAYWAVGTSAIVAATYFVLGDTYWGVVALNVLAAWASLVLIYRIGLIYFNAQVALWAMAVIAFWPNLIFFTSVLSSELYFITLILAGLWFWARPDGNRGVNLVLCCVIWGLACYVRPVILLFPGALVIAALPQGGRATLKAGVKAALVMFAITLIVSPWTARNEAVLGKAYMVSSNFGTNLWMGNNPKSTGGYMPLPEETLTMTEVEREEYLGGLAKIYIREDPLRFAGEALGRAVILHNRETIGAAWNEAAILHWGGKPGLLAAKLVATGYWYLLIGAALVGVVVHSRQIGLARALFHPVFGGWAYFTAVHAVIVAEDRYHMPSSAFIALLAAVTLAWLHGKLGGGRVLR